MKRYRNIKVSASIVLFKNDINLVRESINSFLESNGPFSIDLFIIDNSPTDDLKAFITGNNIVYLHNPSNPGFGASHNIAIRKSLQNNRKYHLVLNPDVFFDKYVISELVEYLELNNDIGNIMPKVMYPDGSLQYLCKLLPTPYDWIGRRFNPFKNLVDKRNYTFELRFTHYNKIMDVPYLSGCFMLLRLSALSRVGLFDEKIFMYGEETDLCRRLIDSGYRIVFYPNVYIYHHFAKGSHKSLRLTKIGIESAIYYFNKWGWFFDKKRKKINRETLRKLKIG